MDIFYAHNIKNKCSMDKKLILALKRHKKFIEFIHLAKTSKVNNMLAFHKYLNVINEPAIDLFEDFLIEHGISMDEFFQESINSKRAWNGNCFPIVGNKKELISKVWPCWQYVNYAISWRYTKKGREFWCNIHNEWVAYAANTILRNIVDNDKFHIENFFIFSTQCNK